jgi:predicted O-methyltransferase YrrM
MDLDKNLPNSNFTFDWLQENVPELNTSKFFTADWFTNALPNFDWCKERIAPPESILEIGCHEGRSTCWMLENFLSDTGTITCVDPFGNKPLSAYNHDDVPEERIIEQIFRHNTALAKKPGQTINVMPELSYHALAQLIVDRKEFDFIYVDGSHCADVVLADATMAFGLLKKGGIMIFDDYVWNEAPDVLDRPKMSIDAFVNMFQQHIAIGAINYQYLIMKV